MPHGELYITREAVAAALNALVFASSDGSRYEGLLHLQLVDAAIASPDFPPSEFASEYALHKILLSIITRKLDEFRLNHKLRPVADEATLDQVMAAVLADSQAAALPLVAWSVLFHRYVQATPSFSVETLAQAYGVDERTLRRYVNLGIKLLTRELIELEHETRIEQRYRRLIIALPTRGRTRLFGREDLIRGLFTHCVSSPIAHILITGIAGIGKSSVAEHLVARLIATSDVQRVIWVSQHDSVAELRRAIAANVCVEDVPSELRQILSVYKTVIVIDDSASLCRVGAVFNDLLKELVDAIVIIVSDELVALPETVTHHVQIPALDRVSAREVVEDVLNIRGVADAELSAVVSDELFSAFGGHPLALRVAAARWDDLDWHSLEHDVVLQMLAHTFNRQDDATRRLWCLLALAGRRQTCLGDVRSMRSSALSADAINNLVSQMLAHRIQADCYVLLEAARLFVKRSYSTPGLVRQVVSEIVSIFQEEVSNPLLPGIILEIADGNGISLPIDVLLRWARAIWEERRDSLDAAEWIRVLEFLWHLQPTADPYLQIAHAVSLRRLGDVSSAADLLSRTVLDCGREGSFRDQAVALVEWAQTLALQGSYSWAQNLLRRASQSLFAVEDAVFRHRLSLVSAQIAIDQNDGRTAFQLLRHLRADPLVQAMLAEACYLIGDYRMSLRLAEQALAAAKHDFQLRIRGCTIIGRCRARLGMMEIANRYLAEALLCAQRLEDQFSIARAKSNLAAILVERGKFVEANELLTQAETIQGQLGDVIGLQVSKHNRATFERRVAG
ncbi:MAG: hypothetical protein L6Q98_07815 [Anaerolineae bacterium]|nr:hypothetical protein [Anaerolineae bacterium]NUQ02498.1 hypothetical protein [Anaerolineae bacterium]